MLLAGVLAAQEESRSQQCSVPGPSFKDVLSLKTIESAQIAPDGSAIAYTVKSMQTGMKINMKRKYGLCARGRDPFN